MEMERKLKALNRVYAVYDEFVRARDSACRMRCHQCCTTRVTLTTLEAYKICVTLPAGEREKLLRRVRGASSLERFRPAVTTNGLAELCAADQDPPAEKDTPSGESCPLLADELCSIYALRPLNCRCFISRTACADKGYADVEEAVLVVNTLFLQTVEHIDADGCSGNLLDVLEVMASEEERAAYAGGALHCTASGLVANRPLKVLMIPPEQRKAIEPILRQLREIRV